MQPELLVHGTLDSQRSSMLPRVATDPTSEPGTQRNDDRDRLASTSSDATQHVLGSMSLQSAAQDAKRETAKIYAGSGAFAVFNQKPEGCDNLVRSLPQLLSYARLLRLSGSADHRVTPSQQDQTASVQQPTKQLTDIDPTGLSARRHRLMRA